MSASGRRSGSFFCAKGGDQQKECRMYCKMHCKDYNESEETVLKFQWDEQKNIANQKKHGICFETAAKVFGDPCRIELFDERHSLNELRFKTIGMIDNIVTILVVVYTPRGDVTRIISARKANSTERRLYDAQNS